MLIILHGLYWESIIELRLTRSFYRGVWVGSNKAKADWQQLRFFNLFVGIPCASAA